MAGATIYDVAKKAGVSISTVSRVLNNSSRVKESNRERVLQAIEELGYERNLLAAALMKKNTHTLGLIIADIANPFYAEIARAVEDKAAENHFNVIVCNTDNNLKKEAAYIAILRQKRIDGIIFTTPEINNNNIKKLYQEQPDFPMVLIGSRIEGCAIDTVLVNNYLGTTEAMKYLTSLGHKRIGFIYGLPTTLSSRERLAGYHHYLAENGMKRDSKLILGGAFKIENGYQKAKELLQLENPPTAIFAANDLIAIGALETAREMGIEVPNELSILGYDNINLSTITYPKLTTVAQPMMEMGARAAEMVIERIHGRRSSPEVVTLLPRLVVRDSTGPVRR
ncbi:HTH-type transcriptional regulator DegA [Neomoorella glycerini]|uniref:HTH-type transcriptional regulator DegA n=1 Tax=Neomoorella glycerini TaxID=55779 RepID=A0A6I5ZTT3_9FIRM|nr:LacI family DNA-binding transcriptional regulator [Moorella glycerini]QGP93079.1 HTH-type transcriptional regulator DegA [Moorella glycerini]